MTSSKHAKTNGIVQVYKPIGKTPYEIVCQYRAAHDIPADIKIGYAGRLDPMADGQLTLMIGEHTKNQVHLLKADKRYKFTALLGISTDTYDLLGITEQTSLPDQIPQNRVKRYISRMLSYQGTLTQRYPPYSSYTIDGVPMHRLARLGKVNKIPEDQLPSRVRQIYSIRHLQTETITLGKLRKYIKTYIPYINGYFRQEDIVKAWDAFFALHPPGRSLPLVKFEALVSSGTYIRSLVHETGSETKLPALAFGITRTEILHRDEDA